MTLPRVPIRRVMTRDDAKPLVGSFVDESEPNITEAALYVDADTGEPQLMYAPMTPDSAARLRQAVMGTPMSTVLRASTQWRNRSRVFGMAPRKVAIKRESCRPTEMAASYPEQHRVLEETAGVLRQMMMNETPEKVRADLAELTPVLPEWRLGEDELWTSGVINETSVLPYHFDAFNFPTASAMPVLRRGVSGGFLHLPEYDITIACRDSWAVFFEGYRLLHGVTPMKVRRDDGYRFSIVYYALKGMKDCFSYAKELEYGRVSRTEREQEIARKLSVR